MTHPQRDCRLTSTKQDIAIIITQPVGNPIWSASLACFPSLYLTICNGDTPAEAALAAIDAAMKDLTGSEAYWARRWMEIGRTTIAGWLDGMPPEGTHETGA